MQHLGAIAVFILICSLAFLIWRWPQGKHMTFSQHAAQHRSATIYYFFVFTIINPLLLLFFIGWFAPTLQLSSLFIASIILGSLFQYSVVIIPEIGGWKTAYHVFGAAVSGIFMLLALIVALFANSVSSSSKVITLVSVLAMLGLLFIGARNKIKHPNLLVLQSSYYAAFFIAVLTMTYLG